MLAFSWVAMLEKTTVELMVDYWVYRLVAQKAVCSAVSKVALWEMPTVAWLDWMRVGN